MHLDGHHMRTIVMRERKMATTVGLSQPIVVFHASSCACCSIYPTQFRIPYLGTAPHFRPFYDIFIPVNSSIPW